MCPNPTVESTEITEEPIATVCRHLEAGVIVKLPCIVEAESS